MSEQEQQEFLGHLRCLSHCGVYYLTAKCVFLIWGWVIAVSIGNNSQRKINMNCLIFAAMDTWILSSLYYSLLKWMAMKKK
jgi:hypothetical protein